MINGNYAAIKESIGGFVVDLIIDEQQLYQIHENLQSPRATALPCKVSIMSTNADRHARLL